MSALIEPVRAASRQLVRQLGFMQETLAGTPLPPSAVHALLEIDAGGTLTGTELAALLALEKSSVSRLLRKLVEARLVQEQAGHPDSRLKMLSLTADGRAMVGEIHGFARRQVGEALDRLRPDQHRTVADGLRLYADALSGGMPGPIEEAAAIRIDTGYAPGVLARCIEMHALYYARNSGFGRSFETTVAASLAEFSGRLEKPCNQLWRASRAGQIVGTIAIDGEDLGPGRAHLRWFIVDDDAQGTGLGRNLLSQALAFCDGQGFPEVHLWTFRGLDAARRLYETSGFALVEEWMGDQWGEEVMEQRFVRRL